jgi:hypothetical protein
MVAITVIGGAVANHTNDIRVTLETGPKGKRVVAVAPDWPGLERGAKTEEAAVERLLSYVPRYAPVAKLAGMEAEFAASMKSATGSAVDVVDVVEHYQGPGSTDFWGISFGFSSFDRQAVSAEELERELALLRACWGFFDDVRSRVSAEMQKGPRGGGRDRDRIVRHVLFNEHDWAPRDRRLEAQEVQEAQEAILTEEGLKAHREAYCNAIRELHSQNKMARKWPLRYLIRHTAFHTLDHAWEMEDKDLTANSA